MDPMLGMVFMVPWSWAPMDYVRCTGQQMNIQQYAALYSLIGTIYGGNGSTTFNVPNLQCRMPMGSGQGTIGTSIGVLNVGQTGGSFISTLNQTNIPIHTHTSTFTSGGAGGTTTITGTATLPVTGTVPSLSFSAPTTLSVTADAKIGTSNTATRSNVISGNAVLTSQGAGQANIYAPAGTSNDTVIGPAGAVTGSATGTVTGSTGTGTFSGTASGPVTLTASGGTGGGTVTVGPNVNGAGMPFGTVSPYLVLNFIIAVNGNYPMRN